MLTIGVIDCDVLSEATKLCNAAAQEVYAVLQKAVLKSYESSKWPAPQKFHGVRLPSPLIRSFRNARPSTAAEWLVYDPAHLYGGVSRTVFVADTGRMLLMNLVFALWHLLISDVFLSANSQSMTGVFWRCTTNLFSSRTITGDVRCIACYEMRYEVHTYAHNDLPHNQLLLTTFRSCSTWPRNQTTELTTETILN